MKINTVGRRFKKIDTTGLLKFYIKTLIPLLLTVTMILSNILWENSDNNARFKKL